MYRTNLLLTVLSIVLKYGIFRLNTYHLHVVLILREGLDDIRFYFPKIKTFLFLSTTYKPRNAKKIMTALLYIVYFTLTFVLFATLLQNRYYKTIKQTDTAFVCFLITVIEKDLSHGRRQCCYKFLLLYRKFHKFY